MKKAILETVRRNNLKDAYIRPVARRGKGALGLDPRSSKKATVVIIVDAEIRHPEDTGGTSLSQKGIKVITTTFRRNGPDVLSPRVKSTNYLNNILAKLQANAVGVQDAIFLNEQGFVCELTHSGNEQITFLLTTIWKEDTFSLTEEGGGNKGNDLIWPLGKPNDKTTISRPKAMDPRWGRVWKSGQPAQFKGEGIEASHPCYGFCGVCRFYP